MVQIPTLSKAQWREDLQFLVDELTAHHLNLFHTITQERFTQAVADLYAAIPNLPDAKIVEELIRIIALIGDGHTSFRAWEIFHRYPLDLFWFGNALHVVRTTATYTRALGTQIVKLGNNNLANALVMVMGLIQQGENEWFVRQRSPFFLTAAEILHQLGIVPCASHATFTFQDQQGSVFVLDLEPISQDESVEWIDASRDVPYYRQRPTEALWFIWLEEHQTVYVCFRRYDSFEENASNLLKFIEQMPTERLILDLRQNGGGDLSKVRKHLLPALKAYQRINQKGRLFVITGRHPYSAAMSNAADFRKETHAILVGEPTGARPNGYQESHRFTLPNSQLSVSCSTRFYQFQDEDAPAVMPDKYIETEWETYQAGRDPVMEWILEYSKALE
ncbi:MAG TPA: S41 family peptidase [Caldilineaceae bacterium]|nr:S41 family peptidase [Caldilineaceae bacterium]